MAGNVPVYEKDLLVYTVGLSLSIETDSNEEEDEMYSELYTVLEEYNTNPVLQTKLNATLNTCVSKTHFAFSKGTKYVTGVFTFKNKSERHNFEYLVKQSHVSDFLTAFLDSTGLSTDLGRGYDEKVPIVLTEVQSTPHLTLTTTDEIMSPMDKNEDNAILKMAPIQSPVGETEESAVLMTSPVQMAQMVIKVYVPYEPNTVSYVYIIWRGNQIKTRNLTNTKIWTVEFPCVRETNSFNIKLLHTVKHGRFIKTTKLDCNLSKDIRCHEDELFHHLVFPVDSDDTHSEALQAFIDNIIREVTFDSTTSALDELAVLNAYKNSSFALRVHLRKFRTIRIKDFLKKMINSFPLGLQTMQIPTFCYLLKRLKIVYGIKSTNDLLDKPIATTIVSACHLLTNGTYMKTYGNDIAEELRDIYCTALEENASLIGFMNKTTTFLDEEHFLGILQETIGKKTWKLCTAEDDEYLLKIVVELYDASKFALLEKMLRHLPDYCAFSEYIAAIVTLLRRSRQNNDINERLLALVNQKCQQCLMVTAKRGGLNRLLSTWQTVECLGEEVYNTMFPYIEKSIIECIGNEGKVEKFKDVKPGFMQIVLDRDTFKREETQIQLLMKMTEDTTSKAVRACFMDLIIHEKFDLISDSSFEQIIIRWLQSSLQAIRTKHINEEIVLKTYEYMLQLTKLPRVKENHGLSSEIDHVVLKSIEQASFKELMRSVHRLDQDEELQGLFRNHLKTILRGKHATKTPIDVIEDICGQGRLRVNSSTTATIMKDIMDLFESEKEEESIDIFYNAVQHYRFWIEIFNADGNPKIIKSLHLYEPCLKVQKAIKQFKTMLERGQLSYQRVTQLKSRESDMKGLITEAFPKDLLYLPVMETWSECLSRFTKYVGNIEIIKELFHTIDEKVSMQTKPGVIIHTIEFISNIATEIGQEKLLLCNLTEQAYEKEISEMADCCQMLLTPIESKVFCSVLKDYVEQLPVTRYNDEGGSVNCGPLDSVSLPEMFGIVCDPDLTIAFNPKKAIAFIRELSLNTLDTYRRIWKPYMNMENRPIEEFRKHFAKIKGIDVMEQEISVGEKICHTKLSTETKRTFLRFSDQVTYEKTIDAVKTSIDLFDFKCSTQNVTEIVEAFDHLFHDKNAKHEMTLGDASTVFYQVEDIRKYVSDEVIEVLEVLKNSTLLLEFLKEVLDEDIRNLIDAVEEHSEQFVSESTVSDLIEVKRFFYPILKKKYKGDKMSDFFSLLKHQLQSGFENIPPKIIDCADNLHTLKSLYKNVANRGERTKEIIDRIVEKGQFNFRISGRDCCEIEVHYKQEKKVVTHGVSALNDLRSRALLLINAEAKDRKKQKTKKWKDDLEQFLVIVDTAFDLQCICLRLKLSGHFDFIKFERILGHDELNTYRKELTFKMEEWSKNISECRAQYTYMNYIYPNQLQQLFEYLCMNGDNEEDALTILQFIDEDFKDVTSLKTYFYSLEQTIDVIQCLHNISAAIQYVFDGYCLKEKPIPLPIKNPKITDVVQPGRPCIVALDPDSHLVIRTMFALFFNTTQLLPNANQILLCREETSIDEIDLILTRCMQISNQQEKTRLYCIAHVEKLTNDIQAQLVERIRKLPTGKYLLSFICCGHSYHHFLDQFSEKLCQITPVSETMLKKCLRKQWPHVYVVSSDVPGLGKTEMIHEKAREMSKSVSVLPITGRANMISIIKNLKCLRLKQYNVLHIDLGIIESPSDIDSVLFQLIVLGHLSTGSAAYTLSTRCIFIEVTNTVGQTLCNSLPTTTCFKRIHLKWNDYKDLKISDEVNSPMQVVCNYLRLLSEGSLDRQDIYLSGKNAIRPLESVQCIPILQKWFTPTTDMSFTLLHTFVNVLSDQLKKLSSSVYFRTACLSEMIGENEHPSVKSQLVKALITISQEFACRSVQSCKALQDEDSESSIKVFTKETSPSEELAKRVAGMIRWEDSNHLMILFHQNLQTVTALYREKSKVPEAIRSLIESQIYGSLENYNGKSQRELQKILLKITRQNEQRISEDKLAKMSSDYALAPDNLLKMILISLRVNSSVPVLIMGETGCGKTSLVRYLADICDVEFIVISVHAGTDEGQIAERVLELNERAGSKLDKHFWLFLDEINTCDHLGLINNILCHRTISNVILVPNVTIIAACNPYRIRSNSTILTAGLQGKAKPDEMSRLVYRVHPLPEAMIDFVWDFGMLNEKDESLYISRMISFIPYELHNYTNTLTELLTMSQNFVRSKEEFECSVSLRDVDRCKKLVLWFQQFLRQKETTYSFVCDIDVKAIILSLAITYHSRFRDNQTRRTYRNHVSEIFSKSGFKMEPKNVLQIIRDEQNDIIDRMVLPPGIARNTALQENIFVVLVCILNRIPIFLVGKPGCSKSLSLQLIRGNLRGKDSKNKLFQEMPQLFCVSFQGSESSTSDGIIKVFEKAENYQKHNEKDVISVVILDEIGLAEVSRFNPLKVLHGLLEPAPRQNPNVAVVGISNWALDAAKMNRAIHLSRPEMDLDELKQTGYSIIKGMIVSDEDELDEDKEKLLKEIFDKIACGYLKYTNVRQKFPHFHGLRDYYSLMKYLGRCSKHALLGHTHSEILLKGIRRNFGGLPSGIGSVISVFQELFPFLDHKIIPDASLIKDNLGDELCRHMMLITNGDSVISLLEMQLTELNRQFEIIFGSHFDDDLGDDYNYRILSRIILCMEQGLVLILKGLDSVYGSLYDMLNQNYTIVGSKKNCRVALGHYSNPMCQVHDSFKCVVLVEETKLDLTDPPFLNRFEKQHFTFLDMLEDKKLQELVLQVEQTCISICKLKENSFTPKSEIPSYCKDLIVSLVLAVRNRTKSNLEDINLLEECFILLLWVLPPEVIVRARESCLYNEDPDFVGKMTQIYFDLPLHSGLCHYLNTVMQEDEDSFKLPNCGSITMSKSRLVLCYTHTNVHSSVRGCLEGISCQFERLATFKSEKEFSRKVEDFFKTENSVFVLQCSAAHDCQHLLLCKVIIEKIRREVSDENKYICIIVHLDRNLGDEPQYVPINYLSGWKIVFIDSINEPKASVKHLVECNRFEIVQERLPMTSYIRDNLFWALTRIKFTSSNDSFDDQMQLLDKIKNNETIISSLEALVLKWIEENTRDSKNLWSIHVARKSHELYRSGSFLQALENSNNDIIRISIAMFLFRMFEMHLISPVFVTDLYSKGRMEVWHDIIMSDQYMCIKDVPQVTGPECYTYNKQFHCLKMPLSLFMMDKIGPQKDEYMKIIRKFRLHNDIDEDQDIPDAFILKTATECADIICQEVNGFGNLFYEGMMEDFLHDFCNINGRKIFDRHDEEKATAMFKWAFVPFLPTLDDVTDILQYMAVLHATYWVNSTGIFYLCHLLTKAEKVVTLTVSSEESAQNDENADESVFINNTSKTLFIDNLCLKLLQSRKQFLISSVDEWLSTINVIVPVLKQVSYDAKYLPALQVFQEITTLVQSNTNFDIEKIHLLGDFLQSNDGQIGSPEAFKQMVDILEEMSPEIESEQPGVQRQLCSYILRCLQLQPDDDSILRSALKMIENGEIFSENLSYFGKVVVFAIMIENEVVEKLVTRIILEEIDYPPFITCFDDFLKQADVSGSSGSVLHKLLVDAIETACLTTMFPEGIFNQIDTSTHELIRCLMNAYDVCLEGNMHFRFTMSVAFIRKFLREFSQHIILEENNGDECVIVTQHLNVLFMDIDKNPFFIYFLKMLAKECGSLRLNMYFEKFKPMFPAMKAVEWNTHYTETSLTVNPLSLYSSKDDQDTLIHMLDNILENDSALLDYLSSANSQKQLLFLGVLVRKFYMRRAIKELNDSESRKASEVTKTILFSKIPDVIKQISCHLLGEKEFSHDMFAVSQTTSDENLRLASLSVHLCCLVASSTDKSNIWCVNLLNPSNKSFDMFPCSIVDKQFAARYLILKMMNSLVLVGSVGFNFGLENHVSPNNEPTVLMKQLKGHLVMNSSDICDLMHVVIKSCCHLITFERGMSVLNPTKFKDRFLEVIDRVLKERWRQIHGAKEEMFHDFQTKSCLESDVDEMPDWNNEDKVPENSSGYKKSQTRPLLRLLRKTNSPSKESLISELYLSANHMHPFLQLVFDEMDKLCLPRHIYPLVKWHLSIVANASYKFRKVDLYDLSVQKYFSQESDESRRNLLKKRFDQFKSCWNEIKDTCSGEISKDIIENMIPMTQTVKLEHCMISRNESILSRLLKELVDIHNNFLLKANALLHGNCKDDEIQDPRVVSLLDLQQSSVVAFIWNDNWLNFSQRDSLIGEQIHYDFEKIEQEVQNEILFGKCNIEFPRRFPSPAFTDDLSQGIVHLLMEIESQISQQHLTTEIRRSVKLKMGRDTSFVIDLLSNLGMIMSILKKTGGDTNQPLIEYLERWQSVTDMTPTVYKRILPEPLDSVKLGHVVSLYQWLEELNGATMIDGLAEMFRKPIPTEALELLQNAKKNHMVHLEKLCHPLMVYVHRCLSLQKTDFEIDHPLLDYIKFPEIWWKDDFCEGVIITGEDKRPLALSDILSPLLAIEHIYETVVFIQDAVKEDREVDVRVASFSADFQKQKSSQSNQSSRRTAARKLMKI